MYATSYAIYLGILDAIVSRGIVSRGIVIESQCSRIRSTVGTPAARERAQVSAFPSHHHASPRRSEPRRQRAAGSRAAAQLAAGPGAGAGDGCLRHAVEPAGCEEQLVPRGGRRYLQHAVHRAALPRGECPPRPLGPARGPALYPPFHQDRRLHGAASRL